MFRLLKFNKRTEKNKSYGDRPFCLPQNRYNDARVGVAYTTLNMSSTNFQRS